MQYYLTFNLMSLKFINLKNNEHPIINGIVSVKHFGVIL